MSRTRLAILSTHPIQYHSAWFRALAAHPDLDLQVYYCHQATPQEQSAAGFGVEFEWDIPLLTGYSYTFLKNVARLPGHGRFAGFDTPGIKNIIHRGNYDAVLVNGWHYKSAWQAIWACWKSRTKIVVRGDSHLRMPNRTPTKMAKALIYPLFVPHLDACLATGKWSRDYFLRYGARPERVFVVPHTVDDNYLASECRRLGPLRLQLRRKWALDENAVVPVFSGKFIKRKRPMEFIQAVERAVHHGAAVCGLMVGDGPLREACEEYVRSHEVPVRFTGFLNQSEIVAAYLASDMLVLPSDEETWGLVVNEAMVCGRACIVSDDVGCGPDLVQPLQTGAVYRTGDVDTLAELITEFAKHPSELARMGASAQVWIKQHSVQAAVDRLLECLTAIIDR